VPAQLKFSKTLDFSQLPKDWRVTRASVDWKGSPLLLVEEGKPAYPSNTTSMDARIRWINTPPKAHHLIHWDGSSQRAITFENSTRLFTFHVQPFGEGWLLGEARGGHADVCDNAGLTRGTLDLGDAIKDVQTTPDGRIWVSYFDEGVFGGGLGRHGLICFDGDAQPLFKYSEFADQNQLPSIDDCYAMNVVNEDEVWLSYYSDFPLVFMQNFQLGQAWKDFDCIDGAFALNGDTVTFQKCYTRREGKSQLLRRTLSGSVQAEEVEAVDETGALVNGLFTTAARGANLYLLTVTALYKLQMNP